MHRLYNRYLHNVKTDRHANELFEKSQNYMKIVMLNDFIDDLSYKVEGLSNYLIPRNSRYLL